MNPHPGPATPREHVPPHPQERSLGRKAALVFILIFALAAANILVVNRIFGYSDNVAATVSVAGKMRMLSQKIAYGAILAGGGDAASLDAVRRDADDFERIRQVLWVGGLAFGMEVHPLASSAREELERVGAIWRAYRSRVLALEQAGGVEGAGAGGGFGSAAAWEISRQAAQLLEGTERLLAAQVQDELNWRRTAMWVLYGLFALDVLLLLLAYGAFRRHVLKPLTVLAEYCRELGRGNYAARVSYPARDEIGVLTRALDDSAVQTHALMKRIELEHESLRRAEALFQGVASNVAVGICVVLEDLSIRYANDTYARMLGYASSDAVCMTSADAEFELDDRSRFVALLRAYLRDEPPAGQHTFRVLRRDGQSIVIEVFCSAADLNGVRAVVVVVLDISYRGAAETAARQATLVFESTSEAIVVTDAQGRILNVNPAFSVITGYAKDEVLGRNMNTLSSGRQDQDFYRALWRALRIEGCWSGDLWNRRKNGEEYAEYLTINAVLNESGEVHCFIGVFSDVTKQKRSEAFIWRQAHYDSLTGLPNRQHFHVRLQEAIAQAKQHGTAAALVMLDLDFFKDVNDTLGHDMGDELLRQVSTRLSGSVREMDTVARLGGDEFTLIIVDISDRSAIDRIVRNLLHALSAPYALGEHTAQISASLGVTLCPEDGLDPVELLKNADLAMYAAKESGRNQYRRFVPSMREAALVHRQMRRDLQTALAEQQFFVLYQPIVRLSDGHITQVEALLRWNHPAQGELDASAFIAHAEDAELVREIGNWVFFEATTQLSAWMRSPTQGLQLSLDFSLTQLLLDGVDLQDWRAHLEELGVPAHRLIVEITETLLTGMSEAARQGLLTLRGMGLQVVLDHFGTGDASLISLNRIGLDFLKIDASLIAGLDRADGSDNLAFCQAAIAMAHKLGLEVIGEGVATVEQSALLRDAWCDYAQGNFYVEPMTASQLATVLAEPAV